MLDRADMVMREVYPPPNYWCQSGHKADGTFRREGPGSKPEPIRFFRVSCANRPKVNGTYCEPCLVIANAMTRQKRKEKMEKI